MTLRPIPPHLAAASARIANHFPLLPPPLVVDDGLLWPLSFEAHLRLRPYGGLWRAACAPELGVIMRPDPIDALSLVLTRDAQALLGEVKSLLDAAERLKVLCLTFGATQSRTFDRRLNTSNLTPELAAEIVENSNRAMQAALMASVDPITPDFNFRWTL